MTKLSPSSRGADANTMTEGVPGVHRVRGPIDPDATHQVRAEGVNAKLERRHHAEVRAGATNRPEEVRLHLFTRPHEATVGSHELHRCQIVERQAVSALQPPDAAAERQAGDACVADRSDRTDEAMRLGPLIQLREQCPTVGAGHPGDRVHGDATHLGQIDDEPVVAGGVARDAVAAASDRDQEVRLSPEFDRRGDIDDVDWSNHESRPTVEQGAPDAPRRVVLSVARSDDRTTERRAKTAHGRAIDGHGRPLRRDAGKRRITAVCRLAAVGGAASAKSIGDGETYCSSGQSSGASGCGGARSAAAGRRAMRLEVALGHPVDERNEERNHAQAGDKERQEDEQQASQPFPPRQNRRQDRRRHGITDRGRRERQDRQECRSAHTSMVRAAAKDRARLADEPPSEPRSNLRRSLAGSDDHEADRNDDADRGRRVPGPGRPR